IADEIVAACKFSASQERAFRIVVNSHLNGLNNDRAPSLRLNLAGAGGTGKSTVIHAITDYFRRVGHERKLRLCSFTGVASKNVDGITLHSALSLNCNLNSGTVRDELKNRWEGVNYLFVDEVSMIGCRLLAKVGEALCI
ncbi:hypothetical protein BJ165DRAFT_1321618, partial [Panaeolus papilionaceus]